MFFRMALQQFFVLKMGFQVITQLWNIFRKREDLLEDIL